MIRAMAYHDRMSMQVSIVIYDEADSAPPDRRILRIADVQEGDVAFTWEDHEPNTQVKPTLLLGYREVIALQEALAELAIGTADHKTLRKDYDAERERVDKLIDTLSSTLRTTAERP